MPNIKPTQETLSGFSSKEIRTRTCTHTGNSECLECDAWDELKKYHKPIYDEISKVYSITTDQFTIDYYKNKLKGKKHE
jgi:hypothetical protein